MQMSHYDVNDFIGAGPEREMQIDKKGTASFLKKVCRLKLKNTSHVRIDGVLCAVFGRNKNY